MTSSDPADNPAKSDKTIPLPGGAGAISSPAGWRTLSDTPLQLESPEGDFRLTFLETPRGEATTIASEALHQALGRTATILQAVEAPGTSGWDCIQQVVFDTSATPGSMLMSISYLVGKTASVTILEGDRAAFDRRGGQIANLLESWKAAGKVDETLVGRNAVWGAEQGEALDAFIRAGMESHGVPGVSVAVVLEGRTVHAMGYGVTAFGGIEPITPETRFRIGSTTKSLTTLMMARLVERGVFGWETPVQALSSGFSLADSMLTRAIRMRHTVNASTGMPRRDLGPSVSFRRSHAGTAA